jgi:hypothetical protein
VSSWRISRVRLAPRFSSHHQQSGKIRAGNQQHQSDHARQHQQRLFCVMLEDQPPVCAADKQQGLGHVSLQTLSGKRGAYFSIFL